MWHCGCVTIYRIAGKFSWVQNTVYLAPKPSAEMFVVSSIRFQCQEITPTNSLALYVKYRYVGAYPNFNFHVNYSALTQREICISHTVLHIIL